MQNHILRSENTSLKIKYNKKPRPPTSFTVQGNNASNYRVLREDNRERNRAKQEKKVEIQ